MSDIIAPRTTRDPSGPVIESDLRYSQLIEWPELPESLEALLYCYNNQLVGLPKLPESLKVLHCGSNWLAELPPEI